MKNDPGKRHFSLGVPYNDLINNMAKAEDRPIARVMRAALREYAEAHHKPLAVTYLLPIDHTSGPSDVVG